MTEPNHVHEHALEAMQELIKRFEEVRAENVELRMENAKLRIAAQLGVNPKSVHIQDSGLVVLEARALGASAEGRG